MSNQLPGFENLLARRALALLESAGRQGAEARELLARIGLEADPERLARALEGLERRGLAAAWNDRWYAVEKTDWAVGTLERLEGGDALLRPPGRPRRGEEEAGYFIPRRSLSGAIDGDRVLAKPAGPRRRGGARRLPEASVVRVLAPGWTTVVGTLEIDEDGRRWLAPYDSRNPLEVEVLEAEDLLEDVWVAVEIDRASARRAHLRGSVVEVLGESATPGVDVRVALRHFGIPERFPQEVLSATGDLPRDPRPEDRRGREDLTGLVTFTIDGESARDFDDAVSLETTDDGLFRLGVHIADVAHYVPEGGALDGEAFHRGTSVYFPDRAVPMLPEALSNGLCSLRPDVPRLTLSAFLDIDGEGRVRRQRFAETVIRSRRRLTYGEVRRLLEEEKPADALRYGEVLGVLHDMRRLMEVLHRTRVERGSIDFDLPEGDVLLDTDGYVVGIAPRSRNVAHRLIEEFMIAANEAVARHLEGAEAPALYRVHDPPSRDDLEALRQALRPLGIGLKGDLESLQPGTLQEVLRRVEGRPEEEFVTSLVLRSMMRAFYSPECRGHFALASQHYTHFTSPIRRYPDLVVHRALKALLRGESVEEGDGRLGERLPGIAEHASTAERRAEQAERDVLQWKKVRFLASRIGESFRGRITGVQPFGFFVQIQDLYVDGLVPIRTLTDDYYVHDAASHRLVGDASGRVFQLADEVEVVLTGVDERHRGLDLKVGGLAEPRRRRGGLRERRRG